MSANNALTTQQKTRFSVAITTPKYQQLISNTLSDPKRCNRFIASITSAVSVNPALQECTPPTIIAGALLGESLNLSPSPQLGQYYLVPFDQTVKDDNGNIIYVTDADGNKIKDRRGKWVKQTIKQAQFILGYKGYIQLAIRSGFYKHINVLEVKEGEFMSYNPFTEDFESRWIADANTRNAAKTVGYVAMFEYLNGFRKIIYWTKEAMLIHADTYSPAFSAEQMKKIEAGEIPAEDMWKYSSFWYKDFDGMAKKTMLRQLISKWGVMSAEMQTAFERDASINESDDKGNIVFGTPEALDGMPDTPQIDGKVSTPEAEAHEAVDEAKQSSEAEPQKTGTKKVNLADV